MAGTLIALPIVLAAAVGIGSPSKDVITLVNTISHCEAKFGPLTKAAAADTQTGSEAIKLNCAVAEMLLRNKDMTVTAVSAAFRGRENPSEETKRMVAALFIDEDSPEASTDTSNSDAQQISTAEVGSPTSAEECTELKKVYDDVNWPKPKVASGIRANVAEWNRGTKGIVKRAVTHCYGQKAGSGKDAKQQYSQTVVRKAWGVKNGQTRGDAVPSELEALEALAFFDCALMRTASTKSMADKKFSELLEYGVMEWIYNFSTKRPKDMEYPWMMPKTDVCLQNTAAVYGLKRFHKFIDTHIRNSQL